MFAFNAQSSKNEMVSSYWKPKEAYFLRKQYKYLLGISCLHNIAAYHWCRACTVMRN